MNDTSPEHANRHLDDVEETEERKTAPGCDALLDHFRGCLVGGVAVV